MKKLALLCLLFLAACNPSSITDSAASICSMQDKNTLVMTWSRDQQYPSFWHLRNEDCH